MDAGARLDSNANRIAAFFGPYPEAEAVAGVRDHIAAFWSPSMRRDLMARMASGEARLDPVVVAAMSPGKDDGEPDTPRGGRSRRDGRARGQRRRVTAVPARAGQDQPDDP